MRPDKKKKPHKKHEAQKVNEGNSVSDLNKGTTSLTTVNHASTSGAISQSVITHESEDQKEKPANIATMGETSPDVPSETVSGNKKYSKRQVFSNWERYSEPVAEAQEHDVETDGIDFEKLLLAPATGDGHFMFKSEKAQPPPSSNLFALDLKLLSDTLRSIPFYKLLELPESYFTDSEITTMDKEAQKYEKYILQSKPSNVSNMNKSVIVPENKINEDKSIFTLTDSSEIVWEANPTETLSDNSPILVSSSNEQHVQKTMEQNSQSLSTNSPILFSSSKEQPVQKSTKQNSQIDKEQTNQILKSSMPYDSQSGSFKPNSPSGECFNAASAVSPKPHSSTEENFNVITTNPVLTEPPKSQRERNPRRSNPPPDPPEKVRQTTITNRTNEIEKSMEVIDAKVLNHPNKDNIKILEPLVGANTLQKTDVDLDAWLDSVLDD